jgi:serine phosphatase RsbU (regulator of sigma subunit)
MRPSVQLRKSTRIWLVILVLAVGTRVVMKRALGLEDTGCFGGFVLLLAVAASVFLFVRGTIVLFRAIVRRTTLRLAFSYFLIGLVPVPLLAALLVLGNYIEAHQFMATRVRREVTAIGEAALGGRSLPRVASDGSGRVTASDVPWLRPGEAAPWIGTLARPAFLGVNGTVWLAVPEPGQRAARLLRFDDPNGPWLQELADRTGYEVSASLETSSRTENGVRITTRDDRSKKRRSRDPEAPSRRPEGAPPPGRGIWDGEWIHAFYLETVANAPADQAADSEVAIIRALSSPHSVEEQLFTQGVKDIARVARVTFLGLAAVLLVVYLAAVAVAFVLVGSIARNVNRLTRAAQAVSRGDYSVRIHSKSRDQIGDLARSFDQMTASIERSVSDRVRQQKVDAEIAMAATIQQKLLPPREATLPGFTVHAHSNPAAEIGGDYYDYMEAPGGRNIAALGDVSGHGLPTGLLVGMAKAGIATLVEADYRDGQLFARLNELIVRSTDPRHYMTLALLDYDPRTRRGRLTNAGQLAPYRISEGAVSALELPAFPLGLFSGKSYPTAEHAFHAGDRLVFFSDGLVEAVDPRDEPFGFERFEAVLASNAAADAGTIRDALLAAVRAHAGDRPFDDDCTLMVLTFC